MGRTFSVLIDHDPAERALAERLQRHLKPLLRKGQVKLLLPDGVSPGLEAAKAAREAVCDADLVLPLLSADLLNNDDAYGRLRLAHERHGEGRLQLLAVHAGPHSLDPADLPGLRALPSDKPVSLYPDPEVPCAAIAAAVQQALDLLERHPPPTAGRLLAEEAFRLDRIEQWDQMKAARQRHALFLLHGRVGQAIGLFAERICGLLEHAQGAPMRVVKVPIRNGVANAHDLENQLRIALARALADDDTTPRLLQRLTAKAPLFLVLGGVQSQRWPQRERQALVDFLTQLLPPLLPPQGHPVQALLMFEYERPETSLLPWITSWAAALPAPLRYHPLVEAKLPSWDEVLAVLRKKGASPEATAALRAFYDELTRGQHPSFEDLANELEAYLG